jgi:hypothetical protein
MNMRREMFAEPEASAIWDRFFAGVDAICRGLPEDQRRELMLELQDHLYESYGRQSGASEAARLDLAIEKIGEPEHFVKPMIADHQLAHAARTLNPRSVIVGLLFNASKGTRALLVSVGFGFGYLLSIGFLLVAIGKPFNPDRIGLFAHPGGGYSLGIFDLRPDGATELLGYWIIPICIVISVVGYWALTRLLRRIRSGPVGSRSG